MMGRAKCGDIWAAARRTKSQLERSKPVITLEINTLIYECRSLS